jgi:hypothetical protein
VRVTTIKTTIAIVLSGILWLILMAVTIPLLILVAAVAILGRLILLLIHRGIMAIWAHHVAAG